MTLTNEQRMRIAFPPPERPTDDQVDRIAQLMGSVSQLNLAAGFGHMTDGDETLAVSPHYCAHCRDNGDGEGDCIHKAAMALAVDTEAMAQEEDYQDQKQTLADALR